MHGTYLHLLEALDQLGEPRGRHQRTDLAGLQHNQATVRTCKESSWHSYAILVGVCGQLGWNHLQRPWAHRALDEKLAGADLALTVAGQAGEADRVHVPWVALLLGVPRDLVVGVAEFGEGRALDRLATSHALVQVGAWHGKPAGQYLVDRPGRRLVHELRILQPGEPTRVYFLARERCL